MRWILLVLMVILPFFLSPPVAAEPSFAEGLWEITATTEISGVDPNLAKPRVYRRCLTLADPVPREPERDRQCRLLRSALQGDALEWSVECVLDRGRMSGKGRVLHRGKTLRGVMRAKIETEAGKPLSLIQRFSGRWIGDCPPASEDPSRSGPQPR